MELVHQKVVWHTQTLTKPLHQEKGLVSNLHIGLYTWNAI